MASGFAAIELGKVQLLLVNPEVRPSPNCHPLLEKYRNSAGSFAVLGVGPSGSRYRQRSRSTSATASVPNPHLGGSRPASSEKTDPAS